MHVTGKGHTVRNSINGNNQAATNTNNADSRNKMPLNYNSKLRFILDSGVILPFEK